MANQIFFFSISDDDRYRSSTPSFRRWSGFVVLLIIVPFFGHAYKRRSGYGHQDRSIIPIPRYHSGRVPLTSALDDPLSMPSPVPKSRSSWRTPCC